MSSEARKRYFEAARTLRLAQQLCDEAEARRRNLEEMVEQAWPAASDEFDVELAEAGGQTGEAPIPKPTMFRHCLHCGIDLPVGADYSGEQLCTKCHHKVLLGKR